jgi:hypothetical protein
MKPAWACIALLLNELVQNNVGKCEAFIQSTSESGSLVGFGSHLNLDDVLFFAKDASREWTSNGKVWRGMMEANLKVHAIFGGC